MDIEEQELKDALDAMEDKVSESSKETLSMLMERVIKKGMRPKSALQLSDEVMEGIYGHAYNLYNRGMYVEASHIFRLLILLDQTEGKYMMGLAACLHMLKNYEDAIGLYLMTCAYDHENPIPHYHAADCFIKLDDPFDACIELREAINIAGDKKEYKVLVERAQLMIESLEPEAQIQEQEFLEAKAEVEAKLAKEAGSKQANQAERSKAAKEKVKKKKKLKKKRQE